MPASVASSEVQFVHHSYQQGKPFRAQDSLRRQAAVSVLTHVCEDCTWQTLERAEMEIRRGGGDMTVKRVPIAIHV